MLYSGSEPLSLDDSAILNLRGARNDVSHTEAYAAFVEPELTASGRLEDVATVFVTNRECPFRCLMCDLWKNTTVASVPEGAVASQVERALEQLPSARHLKIYNSGNFFDRRAISLKDRDRIAAMASSFETLIVESHPRFINEECVAFARRFRADLEVAIGLETVDPSVLPRLNKRMSLAEFDHAVSSLRASEIGVRTFILVRTPFQTGCEGVFWARRSIDHAFAIGVGCCAVIPTRAGNGMMEWLAELGKFSPPSLRELEEVMDYGVALGRGRVFCDLWDINSLASCRSCSQGRIDRLQTMNQTQQVAGTFLCGECS